MPPVSKVRKLPAEVREMVNDLLGRGVPVAQIADHLRGMGHDVSSAGVGRYRKEWQDSVKDLAEAREFAEAVIRDMAQQPEGKGARLNSELLQATLFTALVEVRSRGLEPEKAIPLLLKGAMTQQMISRAAKDDADMQIKSAGFREAHKAKEGDLLTKKNGMLVRVELVEPVKTPEKRGRKTPAALPEGHPADPNAGPNIELDTEDKE